ncbi:hypothetical protein J6590_048351 [Homalodisca vitripennis]|nr:hypothetical protein J6590_048351 [Homalodisca vitripennis]
METRAASICEGSDEESGSTPQDLSIISSFPQHGEMKMGVVHLTIYVVSSDITSGGRPTLVTVCFTRLPSPYT